MFNIFLKSFEIKLVISINKFLYYLNKLFKIKELYSLLEFKKIIYIIFIIFKLIFILFKKSFYIIIFVVITSGVIGNNELLQSKYAFNIYFYLYFFGSSFYNVTSFKHNFNDSIMIYYLKVDIYSYKVSKILFSKVIDFVLSIPGLLIIYFIGSVNIYEVFIYALIIQLFKLTIEACYLLLYKCTGISFITKLWYKVLIVILTLYLAYGLIIFNIYLDIKSIVLSIPFISLIALLSLLSFKYITKYSYYNKLTKYLSDDSMMNDYNTFKKFKRNRFKEVNVEYHELKSLSFNNVINKFGFNFFHYLFFERHKKNYLKNLLNRCYALIITVLIFYVTYIIIIRQYSLLDLSIIFYNHSYYYFVLYILNLSDPITKSFYINCDNHMLHHSYYKEPKIIFLGFIYRFKKILLCNSFVSVLLFLILILIKILLGVYINVFDLFMLFITIISLNLFFSFHFIFMYYIFQPYSSNNCLLNPLYKIISYFVYILAIFFLIIKINYITYSISVFIFSIIYLLIGLLIIRKIGRITFKLK